MTSKITIYVVRHGRTLMNTLDKVQGWCDSPLTQEGQLVAEYLGKGLLDIPFRSAYCSTLRRTRQTAEIILSAKGQRQVPLMEVDGFKEACFGSFESDTNPNMWQAAAYYLHFRSPKEMSQSLFSGKLRHRDVLNAIQELDTLGMAETFEQVEQRTQASLRAVAEKESEKGDGNILVVAHGMSICCMLLSLGGDKLLQQNLENASVCKVIFENDQFTVESMNDMTYTEKGKSMS